MLLLQEKQTKMIQRILFFVVIFLVNYTCLSQNNVTAIEYYFDTEPGVGNGTALSITAGNTINETYSFDVSSLNVGYHFIYIRTKNQNNNWSLYDKKVFYISEPHTHTPSPITTIEYYLDTEPGTGNGKTVTVTSGNTINETFSLDLFTTNDDVPTVLTDFHFIYFRAKNQNNTWGLYDKKNFYVSEVFTPVNTTITNAEFFVDTDPGIGNASAITLPVANGNQYAFDITAPSLTEGDHLLYIRIKNSSNIWSLYDVVSFTVDQSLSIHNNSFDASLSVYPNPVTSSINIKTNDQLKTYKIIDITGKEVLSGKFITNAIQTPSLISGVYFVIINTSKKSIVKKIIKE